MPVIATELQALAGEPLGARLKLTRLGAAPPSTARVLPGWSAGVAPVAGSLATRPTTALPVGTARLPRLVAAPVAGSIS